MKLSELTMPRLTRAVALYLEHAYGGVGRPGRMPDLSLPADAPAERVLALFQKDVRDDGHGHKSVRYAMRLGNRNYPFMKLVLQEHLVAGEFCFAVDTHDEMNIKPDFPDYEAWVAVRRFNCQLKKEIEARFQAEGLATSASLREIVECRESRSATDGGTWKVLLVDDEEDLALTTAALLRARGYTVDVVHDGVQALAAAERLLPDLVILDYEMPEMDGLQVISALRAKPATARIPILFSTASRCSLAEIQRADGFLQKPFPEELLYEVVQRTLAVKRGGS